MSSDWETERICLVLWVFDRKLWTHVIVADAQVREATLWKTASRAVRSFQFNLWTMKSHLPPNTTPKTTKYIYFFFFFRFVCKCVNDMFCRHRGLCRLIFYFFIYAFFVLVFFFFFFCLFLISINYKSKTMRDAIWWDWKSLEVNLYYDYYLGFCFFFSFWMYGVSAYYVWRIAFSE